MLAGCFRAPQKPKSASFGSPSGHRQWWLSRSISLTRRSGGTSKRSAGIGMASTATDIAGTKRRGLGGRLVDTRVGDTDEFVRVRRPRRSSFARTAFRVVPPRIEAISDPDRPSSVHSFFSRVTRSPSSGPQGSLSSPPSRISRSSGWDEKKGRPHGAASSGRKKTHATRRPPGGTAGPRLHADAWQSVAKRLSWRRSAYGSPVELEH